MQPDVDRYRDAVHGSFPSHPGTLGASVLNLMSGSVVPSSQAGVISLGYSAGTSTSGASDAETGVACQVFKCCGADSCCNRLAALSRLGSQQEPRPRTEAVKQLPAVGAGSWSVDARSEATVSAGERRRGGSPEDMNAHAMQRNATYATLTRRGMQLYTSGMQLYTNGVRT